MPTQTQIACEKEINLPIFDDSYIRLKRTFDVVFSLVLALLFLPIIIFMIFTNFLFLGLPILFLQERVGICGKSFIIYKFRTIDMGNYSSLLSPSDGERLPKYANFVRRLRLDEMPQLLNIFVGEMSVVGPRPLLLIDQPLNMQTRLLLRPGITGWAQVHGGNKLTPDEKNALDCWYIYNASLKLDLLIILKTVKVILCGMIRNEDCIRKAKDWMKDQITYDNQP